MAALETPPHTWAEPSLARCHAVGRVVEAPAARLRAFVPEAVSAVSRSLDGKLGRAAGYSRAERENVRELFRLGTGALKELSFSFDTAKTISREGATDRSPLFRMSRADELAALWAFGNGPGGVRSAQATALAWMITLQRVSGASKLPRELRTAHIAFALEAVAKVSPPEGFTGHKLPAEPFGTYLRRAAKAMGVREEAGLASEREAHAAVVRLVAERLRASAHPLPSSELRRAALGCAEAFMRDTSAMSHEGL